MHDAVIGITIRDKEIAVRSHNNVTRPIESIPGSVVASDPFLSERQKLFSVHGEFVDHVAVSIGDPDEPIPVDVDAVRVHEQTVTPAPLEFSLTIENEDRRVGAPEQENRSFA